MISTSQPANALAAEIGWRQLSGDVKPKRDEIAGHLLRM
jgi:hypothetical protein